MKVALSIPDDLFESAETLSKRLGKDHDLATTLWMSGWYEARQGERSPFA